MTPQEKRPAVDETTVLNLEKAQVGKRRKKQGFKDPADEGDKHLVGLAFSGGGIRSATFNLGLLQGLAGLGMLPLIDYLSTVSGGGYIGGWLAAWVQRGGGLKGVQAQLATGRPEPIGEGKDRPADVLDPIGHLRQYSNYLAPRQGFFSADKWVLWAAYLRNFLLNQLVLLPAVLVVLLLARIFLVLYYPWSEDVDKPNLVTVVVMAVLAVLAAVSWLIALVMILLGTLRALPRGEVGGPDQPDRRIGPPRLLAAVILLLVGAVLLCSFTPYPLLLRSLLPGWIKVYAWAATVAETVLFALPCMLLAGLSFAIAAVFRGKTPKLGGRWLWIAFGVLCAAGFACGCFLYAVFTLLHGLFVWDGIQAKDYVQVSATAQALTWGPPLVLGAMVMAVSIGVGLLRQLLGEELREWWSSLCGRMLAAAAVWLAVILLAFYATPLVLWAGPWVGAALGSGWLLTTAGGVLAGGGPGTGPTRRPANPYLEWLTRVAPWVFMAGLLIAVSLLLHVVLDFPPHWEKADPAVWARRSEPIIPPIQVVETTPANPDQPKSVSDRKEITQQAKVANDAEIAQQMYWMGILNTKRDFVPHFEYNINPNILIRLREDPYLGESLASDLESLKGKQFPTREKFEGALGDILPECTPDQYRQTIIEHAVVHLMELQLPSLFAKLGGCLGVCTVVFLAAAWRVDVNLFSLHALYGNRLVRCYLGASRPDRFRKGDARSNGRTRSPAERDANPCRRPDPVTQFDPDDDLRLARLRIEQGYDGPFLIVNAALNLLRGDRLDWQERKSEPFALTSLHCGSPEAGYRPTVEGDLEKLDDSDGYGGNLWLGTAVTISGAAASPNMGYHSSPAVTALLTVFNARLGAWLGNPASPTRWKRSGPRVGFFHLFRELFGWTKAKGGYVYLSDGGHFEDLGVYELVRRRCRYVIVSDAGADPDHTYEDLGNLIHKCRVDFGVEIEIDLEPLRRGDDGRCRRHHAVGRIRYDKCDPPAETGTLIYIKPTLSGDEPADIFHYAESHPPFPHDATIHQFYNESQFESYRALVDDAGSYDGCISCA